MVPGTRNGAFLPFVRIKRQAPPSRLRRISEESEMATLRVVQVPHKGGPFELLARALPEPKAGEVRIKVQACGVCHRDSIGREGLFPSTVFPIVLGHEVAGVIDAVGAGVIGWDVGVRVGGGWFGGHCGRCEPCRRGDLVDCRNLRVPGLTYDGGYAEAMVAPADALALIPDELSAIEAAPLLCAGVTTFNALRQSGARPGDLVAILGIGGLGHLGVQFAAKMGFRTVAIARGPEKAPLARRLGTHIYLDSESQNVAAELTKLGGAKTILATVTSGKAMSADSRPRRARRACRGGRGHGSDRGVHARPDRRQPHADRPRLRSLHRLAGHAGVQRADRRAPNHRDDAARTGGGSP
jgi:D-arabinose 1-dehydrogenase-like Zn-dependent alcohol dehydrogenase